MRENRAYQFATSGWWPDPDVWSATTPRRRTRRETHLSSWFDLGLVDAPPSGGQCHETDAEAFYPEEGRHADWGRAQQICHDCPIEQACLAYALKHNERFGVWGGTTPQQRRALRRQLVEEQAAG